MRIGLNKNSDLELLLVVIENQLQSLASLRQTKCHHFSRLLGPNPVISSQIMPYPGHISPVASNIIEKRDDNRPHHCNRLLVNE